MGGPKAFSQAYDLISSDDGSDEDELAFPKPSLNGKGKAPEKRKRSVPHFTPVGNAFET